MEVDLSQASPGDWGVRRDGSLLLIGESLHFSGCPNWPYEVGGDHYRADGRVHATHESPRDIVKIVPQGSVQIFDCD